MSLAVTGKGYRSLAVTSKGYRSVIGKMVVNKNIDTRSEEFDDYLVSSQQSAVSSQQSAVSSQQSAVSSQQSAVSSLMSLTF